MFTSINHLIYCDCYFVGSAAAHELYGCSDTRAWVAHGFTDHTLYGGLFGDPHWALCVTCGAWLATNMFERALTRPIDAQALQQSLIPVFRGIALFFREYMWIELTTPNDGTHNRSNAQANTDAAAGVGGFKNIADYLSSSQRDSSYMAHTGPSSSPETTLKIHYGGMCLSSIEYSGLLNGSTIIYIFIHL